MDQVTERDNQDPKEELAEDDILFVNIVKPMCEVRYLKKAEVLEALRHIANNRKAAGKGDGWMEGYARGEAVCHAATIIVATKLNYFRTNHHTGQGSATPFIVKIISGIFPAAKLTTGHLPKDLQDAVWRYGHWASTHVCLGSMGVRTGILRVGHAAVGLADWCRGFVYHEHVADHDPGKVTCDHGTWSFWPGC